MCACTSTSLAAPPVKACGTTLYAGEAGALVVDATGQTAHVDFVTAGAGIYLRLSKSCATGARLSVPSSDASVAAVAHTRDGGVAMIGLTPLRDEFTLVARHPDGSSTTIIVSIAGTHASSVTPVPATMPTS